MIDLYYVYAHDQLLYFIKHLVFAMNQIFDDNNLLACSIAGRFRRCLFISGCSTKNYMALMSTYRASPMPYIRDRIMSD